MPVRILTGDCRETMATLKPKSVHCGITSPPYHGLRDYGNGPLEWPAIVYSPLPGLPACVEIPAMSCPLGLEPTIEAFIGHMVLIFREFRRVLRDDGTCWVNMGDSYTGDRGERHQSKVITGAGVNESNKAAQTMTKSRRRDAEQIPRSDTRVAGMAPKQLVGQPWRLAFALQADGWWLRQDVIWHKPNPMPESTRDRCTKAHEYFFLLSKSRRYYWNFEALQEPAISAHEKHWAGTDSGLEASTSHAGSGKSTRRFRNTKPVSGWDTGPGAHQDLTGRYSPKDVQREQQGLNTAARMGHAPGWRKALPEGQANLAGLRDAQREDANVPITRNKRSVWTVPTAGFTEAHFATFPPDLIEPAIKASCPPGGTILDFFGGAGTTGLVGDRLQREVILCEVNPSYAGMAAKRVKGDSPLFAVVEAQ